jgi:hypothetical protein
MAVWSSVPFLVVCLSRGVAYLLPPTTLFQRAGSRKEEDVVCFAGALCLGLLRIVDHFACCVTSNV